MDSPGGLYWTITVTCVLFTTYFSLISKSLLRVSWVRLEEAFEKKGRQGHLSYVRKNMPQFMAVSNLLRMLFMLSFVLCIAWHQLHLVSEEFTNLDALSRSFFYCALVLSLFFVAIPHILATYWGDSVVAVSFPLVKILSILFRPIIWAMYWGEPLMRKLAGVDDEDHQDRLDEMQEELLSVVEEREKEGVVDEEERDMIESVLEFRATTAGEIMTPRTAICGLDIQSSFDEIVGTVIESGYSRYPVYENTIDNIVGLLYAKDLLQFLRTEQRTGDIKNILRETFFVPETKTLRDLLHDFKERKIHIAAVLDEYGGTAGLVSFEDILEELVGEIEDEHEQPRAEFVLKIDENIYNADARTEIYELVNEYDMKLPEDEDYETLGGFVFSQLGHIPLIGEEFVYGNMKFTVIDAEKRKINTIRITILSESEMQESR
ncbi:MAG: HlyC/CorC family transporter [Sedimentisphaerales bacterium]|nr:HlyC/CorC family transporter [Sedimentisphaerales bacterium]MBN2842321.1 HlyC/CorC family transporter [Sedimentisphaerales bacterium]